jgi:hypothetical protein
MTNLINEDIFLWCENLLVSYQYGIIHHLS